MPVLAGTLLITVFYIVSLLAPIMDIKSDKKLKSVKNNYKKSNI